MSDDRLPAIFTVSLTEAVTMFVQAKRAERVSKRTLQNYRWLLSRFTDWLAQTERITAAEDLTVHHVRAYIATLDGQTAASIHTHAKTIRTWSRFMAAEGIVPADPCARLAMPRQTTLEAPVFTPADIQRLLRAAEPSRRNTAILLTLLDTGLRAAELCALHIEDADLKDGTITVRSGKGNRFRYVFVGERTILAIRRYLVRRQKPPVTAPLFASERDGGPLCANSLLLICRRLGEQAQVPHCHPHRFRHTFATWALAAGMDLDAVRRILGHTSFAVTQRYLNQLPATLRQKHRQHGPVDALAERPAAPDRSRPAAPRES